MVFRVPTEGRIKMSNLFNIYLNKDIEFKKNEPKTKMTRVGIPMPKKINLLLKEAKGADTWLSLLVDGAKYRGVDIEYLPNRRYKTHYYCSGCVKWVPHGEAIYKVSRAYVRCPECMRTLKTGTIKTNKKNWNEWKEEE
jgi:hypothetical protein